ncbi:MAG: MBL fold metallo-hydrolase, partial [Verrucomicrobiia bacterium]
MSAACGSWADDTPGHRRTKAYIRQATGSGVRYTPLNASAGGLQTAFDFGGDCVDYAIMRWRISMKALWWMIIGGGWLGLAGGAAAGAEQARVQWFGQSFFQFTASNGTRVVIDPFDNTYFNYPIPKDLTADVLLVTHEHNDHRNVGIIGGTPLVCRSQKGVGKFERGGVTVTGTAAFHDENHGAERGPNTIYSFTIDGVRFCHVGDLGCLLTDEQIKNIGPVDVLLLPVGGFFTLDTAKLDKLVAQL